MLGETKSWSAPGRRIWGAPAILVLALSATACTSEAPELVGSFESVSGNKGKTDLKLLELEPLTVEIDGAGDTLSLRTEICGPFQAELNVVDDEILRASNQTNITAGDCNAEEQELRSWLSELLTGDVERLADPTLVTFHRDGDLITLVPLESR